MRMTKNTLPKYLKCAASRAASEEHEFERSR